MLPTLFGGPIKQAEDVPGAWRPVEKRVVVDKINGRQGAGEDIDEAGPDQSAIETIRPLLGRDGIVEKGVLKILGGVEFVPGPSSKFLLAKMIAIIEVEHFRVGRTAGGLNGPLQRAEVSCSNALHAPIETEPVGIDSKRATFGAPLTPRPEQGSTKPPPTGLEPLKIIFRLHRADDLEFHAGRL